MTNISSPSSCLMKPKLPQVLNIAPRMPLFVCIFSSIFSSTKLGIGSLVELHQGRKILGQLPLWRLLPIQHHVLRTLADQHIKHWVIGRLLIIDRHNVVCPRPACAAVGDDSILHHGPDWRYLTAEGLARRRHNEHLCGTTVWWVDD